MARGAEGYLPLLRHYSGAQDNESNRTDLPGIGPPGICSREGAAPGHDRAAMGDCDAIPMSAGQPDLPALSAIAQSASTISFRFTCSTCDRSFETNKGLKIHTNRMHKSVMQGEMDTVPLAMDPDMLHASDQGHSGMSSEDRSSEDEKASASSVELASGEDVAGQSADGEWSCRLCSRQFSTKNGLGLHMKKIHPADYEKNINVDRVKARWSSEEKRLIALKEAQLLMAKVPRVNEEIEKSLKNRTLEAIKAQRRNPSHKRLVQQYLQELENCPVPTPEVMPISEKEGCTSSQDMIKEFQKYILSCGSGNSEKYKENVLDDLWRDILGVPLMTVKDRLTLYMKETFPMRQKSVRKKRTSGSRVVSRRQLRHRMYKDTQFLFRRSRSRCITGILQPATIAADLSADLVFPYWKNILTEPSPDVTPNWQLYEREVITSIWEPIKVEEIKRLKIKTNSAPGPDGLTMVETKRIPPLVLCKMFNLFMVLGEVPTDLLRSRTIFIPKGQNVSDPSGLRPISITSGLLRLFHRILAARLMATLNFDQRQKGFLLEDGCASNIIMLETLIKQQRSNVKDFYLSSLDLSRAFDSVAFPAILSAVNAARLPAQFSNYLKYIFDFATTQLSFKEEVSEYISPVKGVRQGDPLSPILFNLVMDQFLKHVPTQIGIDCGLQRYAALAYADDILLVSSTDHGMQVLLDSFGDFIRDCGLSINITKSFALALRASGKEKKIKVDSSLSFLIQGRPLPMKTVTDTWRYLGVNFTPLGRLKIDKLDFKVLLDRLSKAPLKPQQRLYALRAHVIPKFIHELTLGHVYAGFLTQLDQIVRQTVRKWLDLPHDTIVPYFHTGVADGGLGLPSFRWRIPILKVRRLKELEATFGMHSNVVSTEIRRAKALCRAGCRTLSNVDDIADMWKTRLYERIDGLNLKESPKVKGQHRWVEDGTGFLNAKDFINCIKLRINALPVRSRTTRGQALDRRCRAGCSANETLNHILQICHRTHDFRVSRHDKLVDYLRTSLERRNYVVVKEPRISTTEGGRVPDLVAVTGTTAHIIDTQVVGTMDINSAHRRKVNYYKSNSNLLQKVRERFNTNNIFVHSLTLNYCGVWSSESASDLITHGLLLKQDIKVLSSRALLGGVITFGGFGRMTSVVGRVR